MFTFAPNISWLFPELPFSQRPQAVAKLGFTALEFGFPSHADIDSIAEAQEQYGLEVALFNQDVPVWDEANRGYLADPNRRDEFLRTLEQAMDIAQKLNVRVVMLSAGVVLPERSREEQRECMLQNLRYAAPLAQEIDTIFTLEFLNQVDNPGYFLQSSTEAIEIVREVNHPHIRFQFDTYHIQRMEGQLIETLRKCGDILGHMQYADFPGRHEPGTGEIDFQELGRALEEIGYQAPIGLEFIPQAEGAAALAWCESYLVQQGE